MANFKKLNTENIVMHTYFSMRPYNKSIRSMARSINMNPGSFYRILQRLHLLPPRKKRRPKCNIEDLAYLGNCPACGRPMPLHGEKRKEPLLFKDQVAEIEKNCCIPDDDD